MAFQLADIPNLALLLGGGAIVAGVVVTVTSELSTDLTDADAKGAVDNGTKGMANIAKKLPLLGTIVALAIVLGVVFSALSFRQG